VLFVRRATGSRRPDDRFSINWGGDILTHVEHPAAEVFYDPTNAKDYDAFVF
jgi:hypothetical protein